MMKLAIGLRDKGSKELNEMFSRSPYFSILEVDDNKIIKEKFIENNFSGQMSGAGIAATEFLAKMGVGVIICTNLGPRALDLCKQLGLNAYKSSVSNYDRAVELYLDQSLEQIC